MKGLFPWLRETLFGPSCAAEYCDSRPSTLCGQGLCAWHHHVYCEFGGSGIYSCQRKDAKLKAITGGKP